MHAMPATPADMISLAEGRLPFTPYFDTCHPCDRSPILQGNIMCKVYLLTDLIIVTQELRAGEVNPGPTLMPNPNPNPGPRPNPN